jgi:competence protein ComGC
MSSINSISNHSLKVYSQNAVDSSSNQVKQSHSNKAHSIAVSDQISISSDGMQALEEERMKAHRTDPLETLVKDGSITKEQKDAVEDALEASRPQGPPPGGRPSGPPPSGGGKEIDSVLNSLVSNDTITDDQKTAIQKTLLALIEALEENDSTTSTDSSTDSTNDTNSDFMDEILNKLVADGSISDEQKTAITQSFQNYSNFGSDK